MEDDLEIYQVFLQVLSRLCSEIAGQSFKNLVYHYKTTGSHCLSLVKKPSGKPKLLCDGHSYSSLHFNIQLIEMSGDICKLLLKETNLSEHNDSSTIY